MDLPIFFWRTPFHLFKHAIKSLLIIKSGFQCNTGNIHICIDQKDSGITDPKRIHIRAEITMKHVRKNSG